jgi:hypothetical protein
VSGTITITFSGAPALGDCTAAAPRPANLTTDFPRTWSQNFWQALR